MAKKSVLITGSSTGIGHHAAHALARRGWRVLATCRKPEDCARLEEEGLESFPLDLADETSVAAGAAEALARTDGDLRALFNNGAYAVPGAVEDLPRGALRAIFETNLFGQFDLTNRILPAMRSAGRGRIVNNSSVLGFVALRFRGAYTATKFAMEGLSDALRLELRGSGVRVILLQPGPITSRIRENSVPHFERWIDWEGSALRQTYEDALIPRLYAERYGKDRFELGPEATTRAVIRALEHPRPPARLRVTTPTKAMTLARRLLPTSALDRLLAGQ